MDVQWFTERDGASIAFREWLVPNPRALVQIVHGVGEHSGRYGALAADLNAVGYAVYADDHRGHGLTGMRQWHGDARKLGRPGHGGVRAAEGSVRRFTELLQARNPGLPVVLLAHSWGSFIAQRLLDEDARDGRAAALPYAAVVLSGSAYRMPGWINAGDLNAEFAGEGGTGSEWLSRDPGVARAFAVDPLTTSTPLRTLFGLIDALRILGRPRPGLPTGLPLLLQVGGDDPVGGPRSVERLARAYRERGGLTDVTVLSYPGARHEVYNETNRAEVVGDLLAWVAAHLPA
ncbi:MAG TPA: alpha/beta fold hydrolase [Microbacteriaceae bacterium]|nr:alpha/beta fold hydrolase [Microbacteriaceae bacterium]